MSKEKYKFVGIASEGEAIDVGGVIPWDHDWIPVKYSAVTVAHPNFANQQHSMDLYEIRDGSASTKFGACEFSNGVWGFYLPL